MGMPNSTATIDAGAPPPTTDKEGRAKLDTTPPDATDKALLEQASSLLLLQRKAGRKSSFLGGTLGDTGTQLGKSTLLGG